MIAVSEEIFHALWSCAIAAENTDSDRTIRNGYLIQDWLAQNVECEDDS